MIEKTDDQWVRDLNETSARFNHAYNELRKILFRGLKSGLKKWGRLKREDLEDIVEETMLKIIKNLDSYMGKARFITWALKIGINTGLTELRHRRWENISLDSLLEEKGMEPDSARRHSYNPEKTTIQQSLMEMINMIMKSKLSDSQRKAMIAVRFYRVPLEEVAKQLGTNRNNLYKLLHEARLRIKKAILREGLTMKDILGSFNNH